MSTTIGPITIEGDGRWNEKYYDDDLATGNDDGTSEANAWQTFASMIAGVVANDRVNMKSTGSPVAATGGVQTFTGGNGSGAIWYRGYTSAIGDGGNWVGQPNSTNYFSAADGPQLFSDLTFAGASATSQVFLCIGDDQAVFYQCAFSSDSQIAAANIEEAACVECTFINSGTFSASGYEAIEAGSSGVYIGCKFESEGVVLDMILSDESEHVMLFKSTVISGSAEARDGVVCGLTFFESSYCAYLETSVYGAKDGFVFDDQTTSHEGSHLIESCIAAECDQGYVMDEVTIKEGGGLINNAAGANTTADYAGWGDWEDMFVKITMTGSPYATTTALDLDSTANEGLLARSVGVLGLATGGSGVETIAGAFTVGGHREGTDDGGDPDTIIANSVGGGGGGLSPHNIGLIPLSKTSEIV